MVEPQERTSHRRPFMGCDVDCLTRDETRKWIVELMQTGQTPILHSVINAAKIVKCHSSPNLVEAINAADIVNADGQAIVWFGRMSGVPIPERVTGIDLMADLLREADLHGWRVYLWGGRSDVVKIAAERIRRCYPHIGSLDCRSGYFLEGEEDRICEEIALWRPDMVFLGMDTPKKELLAHAKLHRLGAKLVMGVGGSFDIWAGVTRRAPETWQKFGLEWLYRFLQEPLRLWKRYVFGNLVFLFLWLRWIKDGKPRTWGQHRQ